MSPAPRGLEDALPTKAVGPAAQMTTLPGDVSVADLVRELQETNRLLRAIVAQKPVGLDTLEVLSTLRTVGSPAVVSGGAIPSPSSPELQATRAQARQLVETLARAAFDPADREHLKLFREETIQLVTKTPESRGHGGRDGFKIFPRSQVLVVLRFQDHKVDSPSELLWNWRTHYAERNPRLTDHEMEQLRRQWPVYFDLDRLTQSIARDSGWILGHNPRHSGVLCASPLLVGPNRDLVPASTILAPSQADAVAVSRISSSNLASPGSLWHFTTPIWADGLLPLSSLARVAAVCQMNPEHDLDTVRDFLHEFCAQWKPLSFRGREREFGRWSGNSETSFQHTLRCFSLPTNDPTDFIPYVRCHRESGQFPALPGSTGKPFAERRMSVLCRWSSPGDSPTFVVVVLGDFQNVMLEAPNSNDLFTEWSDRQFTVNGTNAGYHLLQSVVHRMLTFWEREWSDCLDELDSAVNTKLGDILSDETNSRLMFDSSFDRSRVYFKTLEMLRIFGDTIRETGRDLQELDPNRLLHGNFRRAGWDVRDFLREEPLKDKALWRNWQTLSEFQVAAEQRLLRRIAEKTEEIKSSRDGLFNATSLREAARSTTMNRYVIVFTIMTVLYLPPSFTSSLFGTPLFEAEEQAETVDRFKLSTVLLCVITYVLAFLLIWVADKWDTAGPMFHQARRVWRLTWARFKSVSTGRFGVSNAKKQTAPLGSDGMMNV